MMAADGVLSNTQDGVSVTTLLEAGTSLLVIEPAGNEREGFYTCVAEFTGSVTLTSTPAALLFNGVLFMRSMIITSVQWNLLSNPYTFGSEGSVLISEVFFSFQRLYANM